MVRADPYHWMRRTDSPVLLAHLEAERLWYDTATGHLNSLVETLRSEMLGRVPATDRTVSWRLQGCSYYTALPAGREHPQLLREKDDSDTTEVLLDVNELVDDSGYVELGLSVVSPDQKWLAYSVDRTGDEVYELRFRDLETGADLPEVAPRTYYGGAWSSGSDQFFYTVHDDAYRPFQVWRHELGAPVADDVLVLEEPDERFELSIRATRSGALVVIWAESRDTREVWVVDAASPTSPPRSVGGRRPGVEYHAEHVVLPDGTDTLLLVTNDDATEFRLVRCPVPRDSDQDHTSWSPARAERPDERLERVDGFAGHAVLSFRSQTQHRLRILPLDALDGDGIVIEPGFDRGTVEIGPNTDYHATTVTVEDQSYIEPPVWSAVSLRTGERTELLRRRAPGHHASAYVCESRSVPAPDGTPVPVTLVRHRDTPLDGTAPALFYGYGAYEAVYPDQEWDPAIPSLLDRGVVYVHAHVRGGGEGGRRWWLGGRLEHKQNTFTDYAAAADGLAGLVDGERLATRGLSAGGLLQGAVFSQRPDRWRAVVAEVPFVDVVTTMLDASIPLTITEWDEWGDPRRREDFDWMLAYSPYDNPPSGPRPDLLVTGALHDPRVMVFEPAKWVARLRETDPGWSPRCLFRVETGAGAHVGPAGRFAHLGYEAEIYAWVLDRLRPGND
ncbi:prolyl oligopeptidase family serine peptidase [Nocardioides sp. HM23]|uniref:prolyl oligopeptidase family serine peptidase n=1 Tax=Nocardioides bizhenqiangii TaxID=3095076 RepID=UPI002ACA816D|nr:prolyl oligopeptidase family serine peptidase [Nocardioides sp. HM23]MDZ5623286.1 prolyl oligopeptidase family serine peptidase [Nocardioides sp. HM23]